jgi:hypothetical protein
MHALWQDVYPSFVSASKNAFEMMISERINTKALD